MLVANAMSPRQVLGANPTGVRIPPSPFYVDHNLVGEKISSKFWALTLLVNPHARTYGMLARQSRSCCCSSLVSKSRPISTNCVFGAAGHSSDSMV